jgi:hypothetical protein
MRNSDRRYSAQQIEEGLHEEVAYDPPHNGLIPTLIIGCIGGIIALAIPIAIVLFNSSLFNAAADAASQNRTGLSYQMAVSILGWQCSGVFIDLLIAFAVGMIVGKIVVKRRLGFLAGAITGAIVYLGLFLAQYIPGYPGVITTDARGPWLPGVLTALVLFLLWSGVGGLMSLLGARITTGRHPHYYSQPKE